MIGLREVAGVTTLRLQKRTKDQLSYQCEVIPVDGALQGALVEGGYCQVFRIHPEREFTALFLSAMRRTFLTLTE